MTLQAKDWECECLYIYMDCALCRIDLNYPPFVDRAVGQFLLSQEERFLF